MNIPNKQIDALLTMLSQTKTVELNCDDCFGRMAEFVENSLSGASVPEGLRMVEEHLQICGECREEFEALRIALVEESSE